MTNDLTFATFVKSLAVRTSVPVYLLHSIYGHLS